MLLVSLGVSLTLLLWPDKSNLREEEVIVVHGLKGYSPSEKEGMVPGSSATMGVTWEAE